ncbi:hypothetical protein [Streptomyces sp. NPDC060194]|uniref:hypothetical protein n=1 Tax=Streptomyces sp. NPDC060194 TaxID=3347069 RepID=UPI00364E4007
MPTLQRIADRALSRLAPKLTAEATWWTDTKCVYVPFCSKGQLYTNRCWDSSVCEGWKNTGRCC